MRPSAATRDAFLSAFAWPCLRSSSAAESRSPFASTSAFLQSIMPAPVRSRSSLTNAGLTSIAGLLSFARLFRGFVLAVARRVLACALVRLRARAALRADLRDASALLRGCLLGCRLLLDLRLAFLVEL